MNKAASELGKLSAKKRLKGLTKEQITERMREMSILGNKKRWANHKKRVK